MSNPNQNNNLDVPNSGFQVDGDMVQGDRLNMLKNANTINSKLLELRQKSTNIGAGTITEPTSPDLEFPNFNSSIPSISDTSPFIPNIPDFNPSDPDNIQTPVITPDDMAGNPFADFPDLKLDGELPDLVEYNNSELENGADVEDPTSKPIESKVDYDEQPSKLSTANNILPFARKENSPTSHKNSSFEKPEHDNNKLTVAQVIQAIDPKKPGSFSSLEEILNQQLAESNSK